MSTPAADLNRRLGGMNAPLTAQFAYDLLTSLPQRELAELARHPNARQLRAAMRRRWAGAPVRLEATRRDLEAGFAFLAGKGILRDLITERTAS